MLSIQFTEEGRETLRNLHIENQRVVKNSIKTLASNPELGKALVGRLKGFYSLRVAKYRVIYSFDNTALTIHFIGHRKDVYETAFRNWK